MATGTHQASKPLNVELRTERGSRKSQVSRAGGKLPGVIYGRKQETVAINLPAVEAETLIHRGLHVIDVVLDGKTQKVLIQDVQYDYLQKAIEHVDLLRVDPNQKVKVKVPLDFRGTAKGTKEGGILETPITELELEVLVTAIPDEIRVNVENLELHGILKAKDIALPAGTKLVNPPEQIIAQVRTVKEEVAAVEVAATAAEPEVIGKKKEEEGAEGAEAAKPGEKAPAAKAAPAAKK